MGNDEESEVTEYGDVPGEPALEQADMPEEAPEEEDPPGFFARIFRRSRKKDKSEEDEVFGEDEASDVTDTDGETEASGETDTDGESAGEGESVTDEESPEDGESVTDEESPEEDDDDDSEPVKKKGHKKLKLFIVFLLIACLAGGGIFGWRVWKKYTSGKAYVQSVASLTGALENGMNNRFAGIVESEEVWSAKVKEGKEIGEFLVKVGDVVEKGDKLFKYDMTETREAIEDAEAELKSLQGELQGMREDLAISNRERAATTDPQEISEINSEISSQTSEIRETESEITTKQTEIEKLKKDLKHNSERSKIPGTVKSIYDESSMDGDASAPVTIVNTNAFVIKAQVNEQNLAELAEGDPVIAFSRVDDEINWSGTITKIDTNSTILAEDDEMMYEDGGDEMTSSSNYPFYIALESYDGLKMGQHVYVEQDKGQLDTEEDVIVLDAYMIDTSDPKHPFVWMAGDHNRLKKQEVKLGAYDEDSDTYPVLEGLKLTDLLAQPDEDLHEGMKCVNMADKEKEEKKNAEEEEDLGEDITEDMESEGDVDVVDDTTEEDLGEDVDETDAGDGSTKVMTDEPLVQQEIDGTMQETQ